MIAGVDHGQPADTELPADAVEILERRVRTDRDGVGDPPRLRALDQVDLPGLILDREVAVQNSQTP
ncbi:hypothetical protein GCM10025883_05290 [Mobilicoccus caccae]|uniref:Uncharacterized protein n=1 Tax=Mobilicoccus caccae TaxID=1859295 RepID=A0ABQ6IKR2_9MICO|nr:hypothetical protein GCM10025883_05290 [Mobilicoccus caccae]